MSQRQCLPLDEDEDDQSTDSEMDYDVSQLSALKYLKKVRAERRKIPEIVSTTIPAKYEVTSSSNDIDLRIRERIFNENDPTKEWQQLQSEKFTILQERIVELKKDPALTEKVVGELPVDTSDEEECLKYCEENEPVLSVLLAMNQGHLEQLSEVLATYLAENADETEFLEKVKQSNAAWITKWIYSTLACLCTPLGEYNCIALD